MESQITVVIASDGRVIDNEQDGVFKESNEYNKLVALLDFPSDYTVKANFLRSDGTKPKSQYMSYIGQQDYNGKSYSAYSYLLKNFQLGSTGPLIVSLEIKNNETIAKSGDFDIDVEASESDNDDEAPTDPNQFDEAIEQIQKIDAWQTDRITALENREQMKVLVDFTVDTETGAGVKYYSDGTTATVQYPTGGGGGESVIRTDYLRVTEFTADSWVAESGGGFSLAFGPEQTGYSDSKYIAMLGQSGSETYEAGVETAPSERQGFYTSSDAIFQGSDGSLLLTSNSRYAGRLITLGGVVFTGKVPAGITYNETTHVLTVTYINGDSDDLQLPTKVSEFENDLQYVTQTEFSPVESRDAVTDLTYDESEYTLTVDYRTAADKTIQLPRPGTAQRYIASFIATDWQGSAAPFTISVSATIHGKGTTPICQTFNTNGEQVEFGVERASNGDITLYTNEKIAFTITII